ncbi:MAG: TonB-dependent receptor [Bacteroidota bacterium]
MKTLELTSFITLLLISFTVSSFAQKKNRLRIIVKAENGAPIAQPESSVINEVFVADKTKTDTLVYTNIPKGRYEILISAKGYSTHLMGITIAHSMDTVINLSPAYQQLSAIVVRAEKVNSPWIKSPQSITVLNAKTIESARIWSTDDINRLSPNLSMAQSGDNRTVTGMRGIVTTSYEQAVATYIDGVAQFNLDTYIPMVNEIESIELIRGNQGTLYGRNALGGIVNITTRQPTNKTSAFADVQVGNYGLTRLSLGTSLPVINNKLFTRISLIRESRNGFYTNEFTGKSFDDQTQYSIDAQLKFLITQQSSLQLLYKRYQSTNAGAFPLVGDPKAVFEQPYRLSQNNIADMNDQTENTSVVYQYKGQQSDFTLQSSYQQNYRYYSNSLDADFSPAAIVSVFNNYGKSFNTNRVFTHEARWNSKPSQNPMSISWLTGVYQFSQYSPTKQAIAFGADAGLIGLQDTDFSLISKNLSRNNGFAAFGHLTAPITAQLRIKAGLRWDRENRMLTIGSQYEKQPGDPFTIVADSTGRTRYSALSPKLVLEYAPHDQQLLYISYTRGFRSGGLTPIGSDPSQIPLVPYSPEFSYTAELGWKATSKSKRLAYAASVFLNQLTNIQTSVLLIPDGVTLVRNAGRLQSIGAEWELTTKLSRKVELIYNGGTTHATFRSLKSVSNGQEIDLTGKRQIYTPQITQLLAIQWEPALKKGNLLWRIELQHTGKQYFDLANTIAQSGYALVNTRLSYSFGKWQMSIWGRNLLGAKYIAYAYDFGAAHLGRPRTIGAGLRFSLK